MSVYSNSTLPGYSPESFSSFISVVTKEWNLPQNYLDNIETYFLQHLTAHQISEILTCEGIEIGDKVYLPLFSKSAMRAYNGELSNPSPEPKLFWLSFRAIRYPLGTLDNNPHNLKCYVLIQVDTKS